jgi:hypothetical protein
LELSYLCMANVFKNVHLWDCNYGYGKNFCSFFTVFPLSDAPYTAVYEEQEVFCALHDYLKNANNVDILPSVSLLIAEFIRYLVYRAVYYYPPVLPKEMLVDEAKVGEVDPNLWIALEDLHDGWEKSGSVGQEVYGAGNAFGILPRHYFKVPGEDFLVFIDYPIRSFKCGKGKINFSVCGENSEQCRLVLVRMEEKLPAFIVENNGEIIDQTKLPHGHLAYIIRGNSDVIITWKAKSKKK